MNRNIGDRSHVPGDRLEPSASSWRELRDPDPNRIAIIGAIFALGALALAWGFLCGAFQ